MGDTADPRRRRLLPSILLARKPRFTDSRNDTTATAQTEDGYAVAVSFWIQAPPELSLFSVHCTKPPHDSPRHSDFKVRPHVVGADGPFVLLRAVLYATSEYFLYRAGSPPSLKRIPTPDELGDRLADVLEVREWGVLDRGGGHCLLAALDDAPSSESDDGYRLRIYSSETGSWTTMTLQNPCPGIDRVVPHKVITLGQQGLLAWVDLSQGLLVCDLPALLLQHQDISRCCFFIPFPDPLPGNTHKLAYPFAPTREERKHSLADKQSRSAVWFRDLSCVNGVLEFVEMENFPAPHRQNKEEGNIIHDADLIMSRKHKPVGLKSCVHLSYFRDAWRAVTWTRKLVWPPSSSSSSNFWHQTSDAHVADITKGAILGPEGGAAPPLLSFTELYSAFPILSPEDGDVIIYLKSLREPSDTNGWVAALDIGNKTLKAIGKFSLSEDDFVSDRRYDPNQPFRASTLSRHLDITPGIEVSAYRKMSEANRSANHPSKTSFRVAEVSSSNRSRKIRRLSELAAKNSHARPRGIIQNQHISQVHPVENYLPQHQKWGAPPVYPLWLHENNQQTQQCKPNGTCGPGYASSAPVVHGDHSYQPLWPPSEHQLTSSYEFKPQEAPQTCFNNYHGYSTQLSAPNPFAYGAHTGYVNYQHQWQQSPPVLQNQLTP